ncbi:CU044_5270 family protein [Streptomyces meridianus]|uniref:CU044_5270 family protein n=1 Tax=Streptomyces meridianus TaxID=2938945 RepID=A0ABT0X8H5_9ACTN|nr:CU044_5270 family protein [Streptomyces meridianus]MCM2578027.1 CU044_5270 family protein [Streptomyces meridianus]
MKQDLMRRLTAARPEHLDPVGAVDPAVRESELGTAMRRDEEAGRATEAPRRRRLPGTRPAWATALVAGATAAATVVALAIGTEPGDGTRPAGPGGQGGPGGESGILLAAASTVEKTPITSGAYWYVAKRTTQLHKVPGKDYTLRRSHVHRVWVAAGTTKRWSELVDTGARPATPADREAWRADGAPRSWRLTGPMTPRTETLLYKGGGVIQRDVPDGKGNIVPLVEISPAEVSTLPVKPSALRTRLLELIDEDYNAPRHELERMVMSAAVDLATELPASPELRAAAYRLMASEPGVRDIGRVTDHEGRAVDAVAIRDRRGGPGERRLFFDPDTGMPIGSESRTGGRPTGFMTYTAMRWTDEPPPFDEDMSRPPPGQGREGGATAPPKGAR